MSTDFLRTCGVAVALVLTAACSSGGSESATPGGAIHACEIAPAAEVARIFAMPVKDATPSLESANGSTAFSQCSYRFEDGGAGLAVQIRRSPSLKSKSRASDAATAREQKDALGIGADVADAIDAGVDIKGLGDSAYEFEEAGSYRQLVVYWDDHYQLSILQFGDASESAMSARRRALAEHVIANL